MEAKPRRKKKRKKKNVLFVVVQPNAKVMPDVVSQRRLEKRLYRIVPLPPLEAERLVGRRAGRRQQRRPDLEAPKVGLEVLRLVEGEDVLVRVVEGPAGVGAHRQVPRHKARDGVVAVVEQQLRAPELRL